MLNVNRVPPGQRQPGTDHLRLLARVARMYHERGISQPKIAAELNISQPRVSRLLKQAIAEGIVRTVVTLPSGVHTDLEEEIQGRYGLRDAVVADADGASGNVIPALGAATGDYLDETLTGGDEVGISTWSATLLAAVEVMGHKKSPVVNNVVQIVGGVGNAAVQYHASRLTGRFAELTGAKPMHMPTPGLVDTPAAREAILKDTSIMEVTGLWERLTLALVGIGSLTPSPLLRQSGNALAEEESEELRALGAVGDVCLRFFDADGHLVRSKFDQRVIGISPDQLRRIPRRVGVAGGENKYDAVRASLVGGWVNILITDLVTAKRLVEEPT